MAPYGSMLRLGNQNREEGRRELSCPEPQPFECKKAAPRDGLSVISVDDGDQKLIFVPTMNNWMSLTPLAPLLSVRLLATPRKPSVSKEKFL